MYTHAAAHHHSTPHGPRLCGHAASLNQAYAMAIQVDPNYTFAYNNMGNLLKDMGQIDEAEQNYRKAIQLKANYADAHANLGALYKDSRKIEAAIKCYRAALELEPSNILATVNLASCLQVVCDWRALEAILPQLQEITRNQIAAGACPAVQPHFALCIDLPPGTRREIAEAYAKSVAANAQAVNPVVRCDPARARGNASHAPPTWLVPCQTRT